MAQRLNAVTDNMMKNLEDAFHNIPALEKEVMKANEDPEGEMLKLLARMQKFREQVQNMKLNKPEEDEAETN